MHRERVKVNNGIVFASGYSLTISHLHLHLYLGAGFEVTSDLLLEESITSTK